MDNISSFKKETGQKLHWKTPKMELSSPQLTGDVYHVSELLSRTHSIAKKKTHLQQRALPCKGRTAFSLLFLKSHVSTLDVAPA